MHPNQRAYRLGRTRSPCHPTHTSATFLPKTPVYLELAPESVTYSNTNTAEELQWYRMLYDNLPNIYLCLDITGLILSVNQFAADFLGYTTAELLQQSILPLFAPGDQQRIFDAVTDLLTTAPENAVNYGIFQLNRQDKKVVSVMVKLRLLPCGSNDTIKQPKLLMVGEVIEHGKDIACHKSQATGQLSLFTHKAINFPVAFDEFLNAVSHELRTPLTNIKMAIEMLAIVLHRQYKLLPEITAEKERSKSARYLQILDHECDRQINLINNFLELQRLDHNAQPWVMETIDLQSWLWQVVERFKNLNLVICQQKLHIKLSPALPALLSNPCSLERIFIELLTNACKFSPPDGEITISAQLKSQSILFQVINTGVQIPQAELPQIFNKFYRIPSNEPRKQGGTGLGLALVQKLIQQLGGTIEVESESNYTCFTIELLVTGAQRDGKL